MSAVRPDKNLQEHRTSIKIVSCFLTKFLANLAPILRHAKDALDAYEDKTMLARSQPEDAGQVTGDPGTRFASVECLQRLNVRTNKSCETPHPV
jgi:hypothetical protein